MLKRAKKWTALVLVIVLTITSVFGMGSNSSAAETMKKVIYENDDCELQFIVNSQWDSGFEGQFILTNKSSKPLENWRIQLKFEHEITFLWDGEIESHNQNTYVIKHPSWNQTIPAGGKAVIGFNGKSNKTIVPPSNCTIPSGTSETSKKDYTITYHTTSDWKDAFNGEISITNHTKKAIENWQLEFDFEKNITQLWNAKLIKQDGNHYIIKHDGWNSVIKAGATVKFGLEGKTGNVTSEPTDYKLTQSKAIEPDNSTEDDTEENETPADTDGDFIPDLLEIEFGTDMNKKDTDGDGFDDYYEKFVLCTDPTKTDTDGNGILDGD